MVLFLEIVFTATNKDNLSLQSNSYNLWKKCEVETPHLKLKNTHKIMQYTAENEKTHTNRMHPNKVFIMK